MPPRRALAVAGFLAAVLVHACKTDKPGSEQDSATTQPGAAVSPATPSLSTGWEETIAGPVLLLANPDNSSIASVVFPLLNDSALVHAPSLGIEPVAGMSFDLFDRAGSPGSSRLISGAQSSSAEACLSWPAAALDSVPGPWRAAIRKGMATPLPLDSLEGSPSADSAAMTMELARLASALPASNDASYQGLPFSVRKAYRTKEGPVQLLVGDIVRKINEEANPREERLLLIAEKSSAVSTQYSTAFYTRAAGSEENVRTSEVLAAIRFVNGGAPALVVSFDYENGSRIALIERSSGGRWKVVWRSAYTGC